MKKIRTIILAAGLMGAMIFCMTGCGEDALKPSGNNIIYQQNKNKQQYEKQHNPICECICYGLLDAIANNGPHAGAELRRLYN